MEPLPEGKRYRCKSCGNLTRFDVVTTRRTRSFVHFDLGGNFNIDEEEMLKETVESVVCRWCSGGGTIEIVDKPGSAEPATTGPSG